jgi:hypothetical protein
MSDPMTDSMPEVVLRVRFTNGGSIDVTYHHSQSSDEEDIVDHVVSVLAADGGTLRCRHGDRLVVLFGRGVASVELAPRGAVL